MRAISRHFGETSTWCCLGRRQILHYNMITSRDSQRCRWTRIGRNMVEPPTREKPNPLERKGHRKCIHMCIVSLLNSDAKIVVVGTKHKEEANDKYDTMFTLLETAACAKS